MNRLLMLALLTVAVSCKKNKTVSDMITIGGRVMDTLRQAPITGATVVAVETNCLGLCVDARVFQIDSAITDETGKYEIQLRSNGSGYYIIRVFDRSFDYNGPLTTIIHSLKTDTVLNYQVAGKSILKHRVLMGNGHYQQLNVTNGWTSHLFNQSVRDTTVFFDILPNATTYLGYTNFVSNEQALQYVDTVFFPGIRDTFERSINLDTVVFK